MVLIMLNEKIEKYKQLQSELITHYVNVHNYHSAFIENLAKRPGLQLRESLRKIMLLSQQLRLLCAEIYKENNLLLKEERKKVKTGFAKEKRAGPGRPRIHAVTPKKKKIKEPENDINNTN